ncbi:hypothetical protein FHR77_002554 [Frigoribacterium endophyticum]|nr:hypothetical protein [Frigoribacterium endophyticum]
MRPVFGQGRVRSPHLTLWPWPAPPPRARALLFRGPQCWRSRIKKVLVRAVPPPRGVGEGPPRTSDPYPRRRRPDGPGTHLRRRQPRSLDGSSVGRWTMVPGGSHDDHRLQQTGLRAMRRNVPEPSGPGGSSTRLSTSPSTTTPSPTSKASSATSGPPWSWFPSTTTGPGFALTTSRASPPAAPPRTKESPRERTPPHPAPRPPGPQRKGPALFVTSTAASSTTPLTTPQTATSTMTTATCRALTTSTTRRVH